MIKVEIYDTENQKYVDSVWMECTPHKGDVIWLLRLTAPTDTEWLVTQVYHTVYRMNEYPNSHHNAQIDVINHNKK